VAAAASRHYAIYQGKHRERIKGGASRRMKTGHCVGRGRGFGLLFVLRFFGEAEIFFGESDLLLGCSRYIYVEGGRKSADAKTNNIYESKRKVFTSRYMKAKYMKADIKYSPQTNLQI